MIDDETVDAPDAGYRMFQDRELRMRCLVVANRTAKLGLSSDVFQTADRYYRWAKGEEIESPVARPLREAVIDLIEFELRTERSDIEKIRNDLQEAFGIVEDKHWPPAVLRDAPKPLEIDPEGFIGDKGKIDALEQALVDDATRRFADAIAADATRFKPFDDPEATQAFMRAVEANPEAVAIIKERAAAHRDPTIEELEALLNAELEALLNAPEPPDVRIRPDGTLEKIPPMVHTDIRG